VSKEETLISKIRTSVEFIDFYDLRDALNEAFKIGISTKDIVSRGILKGIKRSGDVGLIVAAEALREELDKIIEADEDKLIENSKKFSGKVVVGTVKGDIHDLGKNILITLLRSIGIEVIDLGVDVEPSLFVEIAKSPDIKVIGLSYLLSSVSSQVKKTVLALEEAGLREKLKIIIGGAAVTAELVREIGADAYANDAIKGLEIIESWISN
jgi:5-methyltetrahydrofolate--homocysteine methyltransferase